MASASGWGIPIQNDCRETVLSAAEQPHKGLALSPAAFFFQHLDSGFICHSEAAPEQFPMKVIIHWLKVML